MLVGKACMEGQLVALAVGCEQAVYIKCLYMSISVQTESRDLGPEPGLGITLQA